MKVVGFAGFSGSGKTTLVEQLIPELRLRGLRVSVVKHAHQQFDIDRPGKDSHRHRTAGATEVLVASSQRLALLREYDTDGLPPVLPLDWTAFMDAVRASTPVAPELSEVDACRLVPGGCVLVHADVDLGVSPRSWVRSILGYGVSAV